MLRKNRRAFISLLSFALGFAFLVQIVATFPWNSDFFYIESLYRSLVLKKWPIAGFHFSASSFFLPDYPVYFFMRSLSDQYSLILLTFMSFQLAILIWLMRILFTGLASISILAATLIIFSVFDSDWFALFYPVHHGGQFLLGALLLFGFGPLRTETHHCRGPLVGSAIAVGALAASDVLFGLSVLFPYCLILLSDGQSLRRMKPLKLKRDLIWCSLAFVSLFFLNFSFRILTHAHFGWSKPVFGRWDLAGKFFADQVHFGLETSFLVTGLLVLSSMTRKDKVARVLLLSALMSTALIILTGVWAGHMNVRFWYPALLASTYAWVHFIYAAGPRKLVSRFALLLLCLLAYAQSLELREHQRQNAFTRPYTEDEKCLDDFISKTGKRQGIGDYWASKRFTYLSQAGAEVLAVGPNLQPQLWINHELEYQQFKPEFAIVDFQIDQRLTENEVRNLGDPQEKWNCPRFKIYSYPPLKISFQSD